MKASKTSFKKLLLLIIFSITITSAFDGRVWIDENGNKTARTNYNPDPNGEPWLSGTLSPLTSEQREFVSTVPEVQFNSRTRSRTLPAEIMLVNNAEFPPAFNQIGGPCGQASGVSYTYSYQINVQKQVTATEMNTRAYGYTHNFLNDGNNQSGSWPYEGWDILKQHGAPDITTFHGQANGGLVGTKWMDGADRWHTANDNRLVKYETMSITSLADIEKIKRWMYDLNGTDPHKKGGCVIFIASSASADQQSVVSSGPHAGEALSSGLSGHPADHAMTFAGYSDNVEGGSLLLVNSRGDQWGTNGYTWVPYTTIINNGLDGQIVWGITTELHTPKYELRATITSEERSNLEIRTGFSSTKTETPDSLKGYARAFRGAGAMFPMEGKKGKTSIEVSLDISDYHDLVVAGEATFFLQVVDNNLGYMPSTVTNLTLIDYTQGAPVEYPSENTIVSIGANDTVNIPVFYQATSGEYRITASAHGNGVISPVGVITVDSAGNKSFTMSSDQWHIIDSVVVDGINIGTSDAYTFDSIIASHTIEAYFGVDANAPTLYTINSSTASNGTVEPGSSTQLAEGTDSTFTITPNEQYGVDSVLIDGINRGPLVSATFTYLMDNHRIEPFFGLREGTSTNDTVTTATLEYRSNDKKEDTLFITTLRIFQSDTTVVIDTITNDPVSAIQTATAVIKTGYIGNNGTLFFAPSAGLFSGNLFDLRGRLVQAIQFNAVKSGTVTIPLNRSAISKGVYILQLQGFQTNIMQKVQL